MTEGKTSETPAGLSKAPAKSERKAEAAVTQAPPPDGPKAGAQSIAALLKEYLHGYTMYCLVPSAVTDKVSDQRFSDHFEIMHELERCKPSNLDEAADLLLFARHALMREIGDKMERLDEDPHCPIFQVVASVETLLREIVLAEPVPGQSQATAGETEIRTLYRRALDAHEQMTRPDDTESDDTWKRYDALRAQIMQTPSTCPQDVAIKLRLYASMNVVDHPEHLPEKGDDETGYLRTAICELEHLDGEKLAARDIGPCETALRQGRGTNGTGHITQAELDKEAREEDEPLLNNIDQWEVLRGKYIANVGDRLVAAREIEALQGRIVGMAPYTFLGALKMLRMAHEILSVRDVNPGVVLANGPASAAIAIVIAALQEDHRGALDRLED